MEDQVERGSHLRTPEHQHGHNFFGDNNYDKMAMMVTTHNNDDKEEDGNAYDGDQEVDHSDDRQIIIIITNVT